MNTLPLLPFVPSKRDGTTPAPVGAFSNVSCDYCGACLPVVHVSRDGGLWISQLGYCLSGGCPGSESPAPVSEGGMGALLPFWACRTC